MTTSKNKRYYCVPCKEVITDRRNHMKTVHPDYIFPDEPIHKAYKYTFLEV